MAIYIELPLTINAAGEPIVSAEPRMRKVDHRTSISDDIIPGPLSGTWVDLLDQNGTIIYRRLLDDPTRGPEVPGEERGTVKSLPRTEKTVEITVLLPSLPQAKSIVFMHSIGRDVAAKTMFRGALPPGV